jgi:hypothetical protein
MMILLQTDTVTDWMEAVKTVTERGGTWTVATSVYEVDPDFATVRIGCRAAAWQPLGREVLIFDRSDCFLRGTAAHEAMRRDCEAIAGRLVQFADRLKLRRIPMHLELHGLPVRNGGAQ